MRRLMLLAAAAWLGGCTAWPPEGHGGFAEHHRQLPRPDQPLGLDSGPLFELELVRRHLDVLVLEGAELCFPATVTLARQRQHRIARQLAGGLDADAGNDLLIQRDQLARLERQLDYVKAHELCNLAPAIHRQRVATAPGGPQDEGVSTAAATRPAILSDSAPESAASAVPALITRLLNSDNQFTLDSAELNPKYIGRLAEVAQLLRPMTHYHLQITGHADDIGAPAHNQQLSLARAHQVGRYLKLFGIDESRLYFAASASREPLFAGQAPQVRLVNRRVEIRLVDQTVLSGIDSHSSTVRE